MKCPCHGCKERHLNCHDSCEGYLAWSKERQKASEAEKRERRREEYRFYEYDDRRGK